MTLGLIGVSVSLPEWLSFKTGFLCTLGLQLLKTHFYSLSHVPLPLEDITFLTVRQLSAQGNGLFMCLFICLHQVLKVVLVVLCKKRVQKTN